MRRDRLRQNELHLVFKVVMRLGQHWRKITGTNLCQLVLHQKRFVNGKLASLTAE